MAEQGQGLILDAWGKAGIGGIARPWTLILRWEGTAVTSHQRSHSPVSPEGQPRPCCSPGSRRETPHWGLAFRETQLCRPWPVAESAGGGGCSEVCPPEVSLRRLSPLSSPCP